MNKNYVGTITKVTPTQGYSMPDPVSGSQTTVIEGYMVEYADGYRTWLPKETFEACYKSVDGLSLGMAIDAAKQGAMFARKGWNGKDMYVKLVRPDEYELAVEFGDPINAPMQLPWLGMKTADNCFVPWLASQTDILATDYLIVEALKMGYAVAPEAIETGIEDPEVEA